MKRVNLLVIFFGILQFPIYCEDNHKDEHPWCFPQNTLNIGANEFRVAGSGLNQDQFNQILDHVSQVYAPIVSAKGGVLVINKLWDDGTVNARAYQQGNNFMVDMFGGLARHAAITEEGLYTVVCHEIGHHLGGSPRFTSTAGGGWASVEGEADYFATLKCMRKVFRGLNNQVRDEPPGVRDICQSSFSNPEDIAVCIRMAMGGVSTANLSFALAGGVGNAPNIKTPDPSVVQTTFELHPQAQCRLDTYFQGSICPVSDDVEVSNTSAEDGGVCSIKQKHSIGKRPLCWYKPPVGGGGGGGGIAQPPLLNGVATFPNANPFLPVTITYDVSGFPGAAGVYIEASRPNTPFQNPNADMPDPNALGGVTVGGAIGSYTFLPSQQLPGWGTYFFRVIPLDNSGRKAVGKFSNPATLILHSQRNFVGMR